MYNIFIGNIFFNPPYNIELENIPEDEKIKKWLESLEEILKSFKWSEKIKLKDLFKNADFSFINMMKEEGIAYKDILDLYKFYKNLKSDETAFINRVRDALSETVVARKNNLENNDDEFPF